MIRAKGCMSFLVPQLRNSHKQGGTADPEYCYSVFLRHYTLLRPFLDKPALPSVVAELGPGSSLGVGLAALLAGADRYVALDVVPHAAPQDDLRIFEALVELFQRRRPIPTKGRHSCLFPPADGHDIPAEITAVLDKTLDRSRLERIAQAIIQRQRGIIDVAVPWTEMHLDDLEQVNWIFSHSVLEHVDDLELTYSSFARWLRPQGLMTHMVDFDSHNLTHEWNGHWAVSDLTWSVLRGRRAYLINRAPRSCHIEFLSRNGFDLLQEVCERRSDGLLPADFDDRFKTMPEEDARIRMSFLIARLSG
jgi:hypothetical protein